jgi:NAD(P)-dependent dehydrogenase (short-subunit alcohol dehydrogenase family)
MPTALVIGARNIGFAVIERLLSDGWTVAGAARSPETLAKVRGTGAEALDVDGSIDRSGGDELATADPGSLAGAVAYLAGQSPRAMTHELQVTPARDSWTP